LGADGSTSLTGCTGAARGRRRRARASAAGRRKSDPGDGWGRLYVYVKCRVPEVSVSLSVEQHTGAVRRKYRLWAVTKRCTPNRSSLTTTSQNAGSWRSSRSAFSTSATLSAWLPPAPRRPERERPAIARPWCSRRRLRKARKYQRVECAPGGGRVGPRAGGLDAQEAGRPQHAHRAAAHIQQAAQALLAAAVQRQAGLVQPHLCLCRSGRLSARQGVAVRLLRTA